MPLEIIGAGLGRTGTNSLKLALEQLGFGPCHHMFEVFPRPEQVAFWQAAADGETMDWNAVFAEFRSQCDWPGAGFWQELVAAFPRAKVILSVRDPQEWYASARETILNRTSKWQDNPDPQRRAAMKMANSVVDMRAFNGDLSQDNAIRVFNAHNAKVKATVPADKLLVFDCKEGWEPLCAFLGVSVPSTEYPRTNSKQEFIAAREKRGT
jgi:hypothetical protein